LAFRSRSIICREKSQALGPTEQCSNWSDICSIPHHSSFFCGLWFWGLNSRSHTCWVVLYHLSHFTSPLPRSWLLYNKPLQQPYKAGPIFILYLHKRKLRLREVK
jgi:hypothetical protein